MTVPGDRDSSPGRLPEREPEAGVEVFPPLVPLSAGSTPVDPVVDAQEQQQEQERAATAQRNKDAFARLGRKVVGAGRSAADATGAAAREAAARAGDTAGAVRDQVADRVGELAQPAGAQPVGERVVVASPGLPVGIGSVTLRPSSPEDRAGDGPTPNASSVVVQPLEAAPGGAGSRDSVRQAGDRAADAARTAGDRAAVAGQQAAAAGRAAVDSGQQAAAVAGQEVAARAQQAGVAAQRAGVAAQQAGAAAVDQTRTAVGDAVAGGKAAVRARTAPPIDLEGLARQVLALPGVARLAPDAADRGRGLLPGQVAGAQVTDDTVTIRVVPHYGVRLPELADRVHELAARYAEGRQTVVEIPELDLTDHDPGSQDTGDDGPEGRVPDPDPSTSSRGTS